MCLCVCMCVSCMCEWVVHACVWLCALLVGMGWRASAVRTGWPIDEKTPISFTPVFGSIEHGGTGPSSSSTLSGLGLSVPPHPSWQPTRSPLVIALRNTTPDPRRALFVFFRPTTPSGQGFAAAHELVMDTIDGQGGAKEESTDGNLSTAIVDHNPWTCRLCLVKRKPGGSNGAEGGGGGGTVGGMLLSPPLWARIGAADLSDHGPAVAAGAGKDGKDGGNSPFFPARSPGTEKTSTSNHSTASAKSGGEGSMAVEGGGDGSGHSGGGGGGSSAAATAAAAGSNLFKGGAMFGAMKMNMSGIFNKSGAGSNTAAEEGAGASVDAAGAGTAAAPASPAAPATEAAGTEAAKVDTAADLAAKFRMSFGRFGVSKEAKKDAEGGGGGADAAADAGAAPAPAPVGSAEKDKDTGFGSLFRKVGSKRFAASP